MTKYTYSRNYLARTVNGDIVTIPDQIADLQREHVGQIFPVVKRNGIKARATLRGNLYGLNTGGTGDVIVAIA